VTIRWLNIANTARLRRRTAIKEEPNEIHHLAQRTIRWQRGPTDDGLGEFAPFVVEAPVHVTKALELPIGYSNS
jgi:hypothetical protein